VIPSANAIAAASEVSCMALPVESLKLSIIRASMDASIQKISRPNEITAHLGRRSNRFSQSRSSQ
jgi:hypothetical protein